MLHHLIDRTIAGELPALLCRNGDDLSVHKRGGRGWGAEGQRFDQLRELGSASPGLAAVSTRVTHEAC